MGGVEGRRRGTVQWADLRPWLLVLQLCNSNPGYGCGRPELDLNGRGRNSRCKCHMLLLLLAGHSCCSCRARCPLTAPAGPSSRAPQLLVLVVHNRPP